MDKITSRTPKTEEEARALFEKYKTTLKQLGDGGLEAQQLAWSNIVEQYSKEIDEDAFNMSLKNAKKDIEWTLKKIQLQAGLNLAMLGLDSGYEILRKAGVRADNYDKALKKVKGIITNHDLRKTKIPKEKEVQADFYETWAMIIKAGYSIDDNIKLPAWCGVIRAIRKENDGRRDNTKN